jgi:hypothetical protein
VRVPLLLLPLVPAVGVWLPLLLPLLLPLPLPLLLLGPKGELLLLS